MTATRRRQRKLLPLVYHELRILAAGEMAGESPDHTLQATALVHEAYIRLVDGDGNQQWNSRGHFFAAAAQAMRRILVESARRKRGPKQGGDLQRQDAELDQLARPQKSDEVLAIDEALQTLAQQDPPVAQLVELRYFAGLTCDEAAAALGISSRTARRHWSYAKLWLFREIRRDLPR